MNSFTKNSFFIFISLISTLIVAEGFSPETLVKTLAGYTAIANIKSKDMVISFDGKQYIPVPVIATTKKEVSSYIKITISKPGNESAPLYVAKDHLFLNITKKAWVKAEKLQAGDTVRSSDYSLITITATEEISDPTELFSLSLGKPHNFFVSSNGLDAMVHNAVLTIPIFTYFFGEGVAWVTVPTIIKSVYTFLVCWGVQTIGDALTRRDRMPYSPETHGCGQDVPHDIHVTDCGYDYPTDKPIIVQNNDAQAPGKPTENDGFVPAKNWEGEKVKSKKGWGWPDKKGDIWVPTGPKGHGCPHWDVQLKKGGYKNIVPGGRIRGAK